MDEAAYRTWLEAEGYGPNTVSTQLSLARRLEAAYGDLAARAAGAGWDEMAAELRYSAADERAGRPNPSRIEIGGNLRTALASYRTAAALFRSFLSEAGSDAPPLAVTEGSAVAGDRSVPDLQRFALERDMQRALRRDIAALEPGLEIVDDGVERAVASGQIDILCRDPAGALVVVELKAGRTDPRVIAQILGYVGDLMEEEAPAPVRGIIVAEEFDARTRAAARAVPTLRLVRYRIAFHFGSPDGDAP